MRGIHGAWLASVPGVGHDVHGTSSWVAFRAVPQAADVPELLVGVIVGVRAVLCEWPR